MKKITDVNVNKLEKRVNEGCCVEITPYKFGEYDYCSACASRKNPVTNEEEVIDYFEGYDVLTALSGVMNPNSKSFVVGGKSEFGKIPVDSLVDEGCSLSICGVDGNQFKLVLYYEEHIVCGVLADDVRTGLLKLSLALNANSEFEEHVFVMESMNEPIIRKRTK